MLNYIKTFIAFVILTLLTTESFAQISRNFTRKDRPIYELGAGIIGISVPNYPGASNATFRTIPFPWVIYRGDYLKADEEGNRIEFFKSKDLELGVSGGFNFPIESSENKARLGMPDTGALLGIGPALMYRFPYDGGLQRITMGLGLRVNFSIDEDVDLKEQGFLVEPNIRYWVKTSRTSPLTLFSSVSMSFADTKYNEFFYEVEEAYVTPTREKYKARAGIVDVAASLGFSLELTKKTSTFGGIYYSNLTLAGNKLSPLVEDEHNIGFALGIAWMFFEKSGASLENVIK